ncbi:MAG TPA: response regulator transcription factor [Candidatus Obscuribacter sp.]|nr:response regulator transcription factor [Candidatus Obscuribacter sp.]
MAKILLVENEPDLADVVKDWLEDDLHSVQVLNDGSGALEVLSRNKFDLVILDLMIPGVDGFSVCQNYRQSGGESPILMLTARKSMECIEAGLDAGADDYLAKPFQLRDLSDRIRLLLRRPAGTVMELRAGDLLLQRRSYRVTKGGTLVRLLPKEFLLLEYLMRNCRKVVSVDALIDHAWGSESSITSETVRSYIKTLRKKLDTPGADSLIKNVYGMGYKLDLEE